MLVGEEYSSNFHSPRYAQRHVCLLPKTPQQRHINRPSTTPNAIPPTDPMTIYGIGGVSGTGKTHFRTTCESLRGARALDIADVYEESVAAGRPDLHWKTALERFEARVRGRLEEDRSGDIVLEAFFRPDGAQRQVIEDLAQEFGVYVR